MAASAGTEVRPSKPVGEVVGRRFRMDLDEINGATIVVRNLCSEGISWYRNSRTPKWDRTFASIGSQFEIFPDVDSVERNLLRGCDETGAMTGEINGPYILLAPPTQNRDIVCLLGIYWCLAKVESQMTLYLNMFGESRIQSPKPWYRGYRLELPHRAGMHNYTHVQPCNATGWVKKIRIDAAEPSIPDNFPAFAIRGNTLTTLCAALAMALYGSKKLGTVVGWLAGQRPQADVQRLLQHSP